MHGAVQRIDRLAQLVALPHDRVMLPPRLRLGSLRGREPMLEFLRERARRGRRPHFPERPRFGEPHLEILLLLLQPADLLGHGAAFRRARAQLPRLLLQQLGLLGERIALVFHGGKAMPRLIRGALKLIDQAADFAGRAFIRSGIVVIADGSWPAAAFLVERNRGR